MGRARDVLVAVGVVGAAVALGLVVLVRGKAPAGTTATARGGTAGDGGAGPGAVVVPGEPDQGAGAAPFPTERDALAGAPGPGPAPQRAAPGITLLGRLVRPDRRPVEAVHVRATIERLDAAGETVETVGRLAEERTEALAFPGLAPGPYRVRVQADGFRPCSQRIELAAADAEPSGDAVPVVSERIYLWPERWIAVRAVTPAGEPFPALAEELGLEPVQVFVLAFQAAASRSPLPADADPAQVEQEGVARFHPPSGHKQYVLPDGVLGSLERTDDAPREALWVGLWVYGALVDQALVQPDAASMTFVLHADVLLQRFAEVRLRVLDSPGGQPARDVRATLRADDSAHRRDDLSRQAPGEDGTLVFRRVMPGRHELTVEGAGGFFQRRLELAPGERVDLGDVAMGTGATVRIEVTDPDGDPAYAAILLAPFERGTPVDELLPPSIHRYTDDEGVYLLPAPTEPVLVRARMFPRHLDPAHPMIPEDHSRDARIDPADLPAVVHLVLEPNPRVRFAPQAPWDASHSLAVVDDLGLVQAVVRGRSARDLEATLPPGPYRVRRRGAGGEDLGVVDVRVEPGTTTLAVP